MEWAGQASDTGGRGAARATLEAACLNSELRPHL